MQLIGRRKKKKFPPEQVLRYAELVLKGLAAQRVARKVTRRGYRGYKWTRRLPFLVAGWAIVAFVVRKVTKSSGGDGDTGFTPPSPAPSSTSPAPAATPSTPTPTGSPTAVTPAPTAAADGAPETEAPSAEKPAGEDAGSKS